MNSITPYHAKYFAHFLTRKLPANDLGKLTASLHDAQVDLTPHQVEAALFAFKSPLSHGAILADEVGLGKTIEAGIILSQQWAEHKRRLLIIAPANLRKQWSSELQEKFFLSSVIMEKKSFEEQINKGNFNPFFQDSIIICSFQFAKAKAPYLRKTEWDLVIIDEAHRLRNVYKPQNKIANTIKNAIEDRKKVLLTATPLQNSILELYGLVSIIDDFIFGDLKSFKGQFGKQLNENDYRMLRDRLQPVCKRTLRRQVLEYIKYTKRIAIREEFFPTKEEQELYELVSEYLQRPKLFALPRSQRQLMTLILRKLLASSTFAIHGTFCGLIDRLNALLLANSELDANDFSLDFEGKENEAEEWIDDDETEMDESDDMLVLSPNDIESVKKELSDLERFRDLSAIIKKNSKAEHLFTALEKGFAELARLGANRKALLFTESKRTQTFLYELLENRGFKDKVVLFNGTNTDPQSKAIYEAWLKKYQGSNKITGSPTADKRAAIVEYFRDEATIMIATEAASEGINLQFCSLVVNYDMPWNPQRIEQRIGRCHRYGQKHDVVVVNFLNKSNAADIRVYELLDEKFKLFDGVFGVSDEVLGSIGNGIDFEKRIAQIYDECRTSEEISEAFDNLQEELQVEISEKMLNARSILTENFDEVVHEKLRTNLVTSLGNISLFEKRLWSLTKFYLESKALFKDESYSFILPPNQLPSSIHSGEYAMIVPKEGEKKSSVSIPDQATIYRIGDSLAQYIIKRTKENETTVKEVVFDYSGTPVKVSLLEPYIGKWGWLQVNKLTVESFEYEDYLMIACIAQDGTVIEPDVAERFFSLSAQIGLDVSISEEYAICCLSQLELQKEAIIQDNAHRNRNFFDEEMEKLDKWAEDMKLSLEKEITDMDAEIRLRKSEAKKQLKLEVKVKLQREIKELERKRSEKRQMLFEAQDEVDDRKEKLLSEIEKMLAQRLHQEEVFTIKWKLI